MYVDASGHHQIENAGYTKGRSLSCVSDYGREQRRAQEDELGFEFWVLFLIVARAVEKLVNLLQLFLDHEFYRDGLC